MYCITGETFLGDRLPALPALAHWVPQSLVRFRVLGRSFSVNAALNIVMLGSKPELSDMAKEEFGLDADPPLWVVGLAARIALAVLSMSVPTLRPALASWTACEMRSAIPSRD